MVLGMSPTVLSLLAYLGASIGASFAVLQVHRTITTRTTQGLSTLSFVAMSLNTGCWLAYGIVHRIPQQLLSNTPWFVMVLILGWFFARDGRLPLTLGLGIPPLLLALGLVANSLSNGVMAPLALALTLLTCVPQLLVSLRSTTHAGVSRTAWIASTLAGACWLLYGVGSTDVPVILAAGPSLVLNALNVWALTRRASAAHTPALPSLRDDHCDLSHTVSTGHVQGGRPSIPAQSWV